MGQTASLMVQVPVEMNQRLEKLAETTARPKSSLVVEAIAEYVKIRERQMAAIERGLADIKAGRIVPHEEVEEWLDSWGTDHELPPPKCE